MRRALLVAVGLVAVGLVGVLVVGSVLMGALDDASDPATGGCEAGTVLAAADVAPTGAAGVDGVQSRNAATIVAVGRKLGVPARGWVVALATARQEATLRNLASRANPGSLAYPHDAVAPGDHDSVGIFQQRDSWGSLAVRMDVAQSAGLFYRALLGTSGWQGMSVAAAAQAVQVSAFPSAYARWEGLARQLVAKVAGADVDTAAVAADCASIPVTGSITYPLPAGSGFRDAHNYGNGGAVWAHGHTGTDLSVACGTPVLAATGGTVVIDTTQGWAGRWLVKVSTGPGALTTWYAHMQALSVSAGQSVTAGQPLGQVGQLGNATGCHLHFEVHPHGGGIYEDGINPSAWLDRSTGRNLPVAAVPSGSGITVATFNTLGSSHTAPGGKSPDMASGAQRTVWAVDLLDHYRVDVAGLQEFQGPQAATLRARAGDRYDMWHPAGDSENAVIWRSAAFTLAGTDTLTIPYFDGHPRRMPIVKLVDPGGQAVFVLNVHNPADTRRFHNQGRYRAEAVRREVAQVSNLVARFRLPVIVTGDANDHGPFYCPFTVGRLTIAAAGGSNIGGCSPPTRGGIDWIMGTPDLGFTGYTTDRGPLVDRTSDHPFVVTQAQTIN